MDYKVIIVGGGYSGLTQAKRLKENQVEDVLIIEFEEELGGRPWDGRLKISAPFQTITSTKVTKIEKKDNGFVVKAQDKEGGKTFTTDKIILTTGSVERERFFDYIPGDRPSGDCVPKLALNLLKRGYAIGLNPLIVQSNEYATELIERLSNYSEVNVQTINLEQFEILSVIGRSRVEKVEVKELSSGDIRTIEADAFVYANGIMPMTHSILELEIELNKDKFVITNENGETSLEGFYAFGDCAVINN